MRRFAGFLASLLLAAPLLGQADTSMKALNPLGPNPSLNDFVTKCNMDQKGNAGAMRLMECAGYLRGLIEGVLVTTESLSAPPFFCLPGSDGTTMATTGQVFRVVEKYASKNPEILHEAAAIHVAVALMDAFPCKQSVEKP
jgi:hypothetical protein